MIYGTKILWLILILSVSYCTTALAQTDPEIGDAKADNEPAAVLGKVTEQRGGFSSPGAFCRNGLAKNYPCLGVNLRSVLTPADLGGGPGIGLNDIWGWFDEEYNKHYIIVGREDATAFVDVSNPNVPVYLGELPRTSTSPVSIWRDIKVMDHYAFIVADGAKQHGMQVFDLHQLRNFTGIPSIFSVSVLYDKIASSHNIVIDEESRFAYAVGSRSGGVSCGGGLHIIDINDPLNPSFVDCYSNSSSRRGYTHDAQCTVYRGPDVEHYGKQICFTSDEDALGIVDLTSKQNPVPLGVGTYPTSRYVHQGWLTEDHSYFYQGDEQDEGSYSGTRTLIWDVRDLDDPILIKEYIGSVLTIDHNQYILGNYAYQANYTSGLRILDITDPVDPILFKYFDTFPSGNQRAYAGAWSVFPFFNNGIVYVSSRDEGLFILDTGGGPVTDVTNTEISVEGTSVRFDWETNAEFGVHGFEIQERLNDGLFAVLEFIPALGTTLEPQSYSQTLKDVSPGRHEYRLQTVSVEDYRFTEVSGLAFVIPETHVISAAYPNPSNISSIVELIVAERQYGKVTLFDIQGKEVDILYDGELTVDSSLILKIDAVNLASGAYFLRVLADKFSDTVQLVVAR